MTPDEILKLVLAMSDEGLTAKVAELQGLTKWQIPAPRRPEGRAINMGWNDAQGRFIHKWDWSPPTEWRDAGELFEELGYPWSINAAHGGTATVSRNIAGKIDAIFGMTAPLAITYAYLWCKMCEKEEAP